MSNSLSTSEFCIGYLQDGGTWALASGSTEEISSDSLTSYQARLSSSITIPLWSWFFSASGDPADTDYTAVGCAITTISSNLTEMSKGVKLLAALMDDDVGSGEDLLRAARTLAGAVSDLLKAVQPTSGEVSPKDP